MVLDSNRFSFYPGVNVAYESSLIEGSELRYCTNLHHLPLRKPKEPQQHNEYDCNDDDTVIMQVPDEINENGSESMRHTTFCGDGPQTRSPGITFQTVESHFPDNNDYQDT